MRERPVFLGGGGPDTQQDVKAGVLAAGVDCAPEDAKLWEGVDRHCQLLRRRRAHRLVALGLVKGEVNLDGIA